VQLALSPCPADQRSGTGARQSPRMNKLVIGGVAALGATVIAVNPVATNAAALEIQQRAVALVAAVTDSPGTVYQELVTNTFTNLATLGSQIAANPFPILSAIAANQQGYAAKFGTAFTAAGTAFSKWWESGSRESLPGKTLLANIQTALAAGDFGTAYENFNKIALFGIQNTILPILTGTIFSSGTNMGIPQQMAQNFADAVGAFFTSGTLVYGAFQSVYAPVSGAMFAASRAIEAVSTAISAGDVQTAVTALVNTPGVVLNAFLNGFEYNPGSTTEAWAGLFSPKGVRASGGPISQFLITIPAKIAAAIANTPAAPKVAVASSDIAALPTIALSGSGTIQTADVKVGADAAAVETAGESASGVATSGTTTEAATGGTAVTETATEEVAAGAAPTTAKSTTGVKAAADRVGAALKKFGAKATTTSVSTDDSSATAGGNGSSPKRATTSGAKKSAASDSSATAGAKGSTGSAKNAKTAGAKKSAGSDS
jgi:hypothetical protein